MSKPKKKTPTARVGLFSGNVPKTVEESAEQLAVDEALLSRLKDCYTTDEKALRKIRCILSDRTSISPEMIKAEEHFSKILDQLSCDLIKYAAMQEAASDMQAKPVVRSPRFNK